VIPLRDDVPSRSYPFVNVALIGASVLMFILELGTGDDLPAFFHRFAVIPALFSARHHSQADLAQRVLVSMFLHGGWLHILGNMLYLWIFGDNVEDRMGHLRYLVFYLVCGWAATYGQIWADPRSSLPSIGASGAIAGVLAAYLVLYPHARVVTVIPLGFVFPTFEVPAFFFLGFWFLQQFLFGSLTLAQGTGPGGGTAWWAHIGGFLAGLALVGLFQNPARRPPSRGRGLRGGATRSTAW
jgi:membrane associated rhomboid family serine protease